MNLPRPRYWIFMIFFGWVSWRGLLDFAFRLLDDERNLGKHGRSRSYRSFKRCAYARTGFIQTWSRKVPFAPQFLEAVDRIIGGNNMGMRLEMKKLCKSTTYASISQRGSGENRPLVTASPGLGCFFFQKSAEVSQVYFRQGAEDLPKLSDIWSRGAMDIEPNKGTQRNSRISSWELQRQ